LPLGSDKVLIPLVEPTDLILTSRTEKQKYSLKLAVQFVIDYGLKPEFGCDSRLKSRLPTASGAPAVAEEMIILTPRLGRTSTRR
jgi:hypothetical protein